jgi:putative flippase GtrA
LGNAVRQPGRALPHDGLRMLRFGLVGVLNTGLDFLVFALLFYGLAWPLLVANSLGYLAALANSYLLNSRWTFGDRPGNRSPARPLRYAGLNGVGLLLGNLAVGALALMLPVWVAKLCAVTITFAWNYWSSDRMVFLCE